MDINSTTFAAATSTLVTDGNITLSNGTTIKVTSSGVSDDTLGSWFSGLSDSSTAGYKDFNNSEGLIVNAGGTLDVNVSEVSVTDASAFFKYTVKKTGENLSLVVAKDANGLKTLVEENNAGDTGKGAAEALGTIFAGTTINADIDTYLTALDALETDASKVKAVEESTSQIETNSADVSNQIVSNVSAVVQARQASMRGFNSGDKTYTDKNIWIKPFVSKAKQNDVDGINGFNVNASGIGFGVDGKSGNGTRLGAAIFYTKAKADVNHVTQSSNMDVYSLIGYASQPIVDDKSFIFYQLGVNLQKNDTSRYLSVTSQTVIADYTSKNYMAQVKATTEKKIDNKLALIPVVIATYKYYDSPAYTETGAGGMNLNVKGYTSDDLFVGAGSDLKYKLGDDIELLANVLVQYNFINNTQSVTSSYIGAPSATFDTKGIENSSWGYEAGFGVAKKLKDNLSFDLKYDTSGLGDSFITHTVSAKINLKF